MEQYLSKLDCKEESKEEPSCKLAVVHSRYASNRKLIDLKHAHPVTDGGDRILVFHNGFITNTSELIAEMCESEQQEKQMKDQCTDSQLIAILIGREMDKGESLR